MGGHRVIFGMLRVKNEARWIARVIQSIQPVCGRILVLDDHSDDGTPDICELLGARVFRSPFEGIHEARDKDFLLDQVWTSGATVGDYCLMIDGDEALHPADIPAIHAAVAQGLPCCTMHIVYLWDREDQIRVDRWYREFRRPSLFCLCHRGLTFKRTEFGGNFHCSSAPAQLLPVAKPIPARLLHFGYLHREDRVRKYHWYNQVDPNNAIEDGYRHMVIGDLFPAESSFRWAGPLELETIGALSGMPCGR
jgi:glycosyltransferase involved in cell wall biosynthesis